MPRMHNTILHPHIIIQNFRLRPSICRRCANAVFLNGFDLAINYPYTLEANDTGIV